jgi:hypothetical protein
MGSAGTIMTSGGTGTGGTIDRVDEDELSKTSTTQITSLQQLAGRSSGARFVDLQFIGQTQLIFDLSQPSQIWLRLNHIQRNDRFDIDCRFNSMRSLVPHIKSFDVSDNMNAIYTESSWYLEGARMDAATTGHLRLVWDVSVEQ